MSQLSPASGPQPGGTTVTVSGTGLGAVTEVLFGGVPATSIRSVSATEVVAVSPPGHGAVDVTVRGASGESSPVFTDRFTYADGSVAGFTAVTPTRVLDTRTYGVRGFVGPGGDAYLDLEQDTPLGATAALVTLTAVSPTSPTYLAVDSSDPSAGRTSSIDAGAGETVASEVVVPLDAARTAEIRNAAGRVDVVVDLLGYYSDDVGDGQVPVSPTRVLDTRSGRGSPARRVGPGETVHLDLSADLPADAVTATLNLTAVSPTAPTFVTAYPDPADRPRTSNLNVARGQTIATAVTVPVRDGGLTLYNSAGDVDLVADLTGYGVPDGGSALTPVTAVRVFDDRPGGLTRAGADVLLTSPAGLPLVPATARAAVVTVTAVAHGAPDYLTAAAYGTTPTASTVNVATGQTRANLAVVPVTVVQGVPRFTLRQGTRTAYAIVDLVGYLQPDPVTVVPRPLAPATAGLDYGQDLVAEGGIAPDTWSVSAGSLPQGLSIQGTQIVGRPSAPGTSVVTLTVTAADGAASNEQQTIDVEPAASANTSSSTLSGATALAAGGDHTCALVSGSVWCWGLGTSGQLGRGGDGSSLTPAPAVGLGDAVGLAAAGRQTCAVRSGGGVDCFGAAPLGDGTSSPASTPTAVSGITDATSVTVGQSFACALHASGQVSCWGADGSGQLGDGGQALELAPVSVVGLDDATSISAGFASTCATRRGGSVVCWGRGDLGELGSTTAGSAVPIAVPGVSDAIAVQASEFATCAALRSGSSTCWGSAEPQVYANEGPTAVPALAGGDALASVGGVDCLIGSGGATSCAGSDLGRGIEGYSDVLLPVPGLAPATAVAAADGHVCALVGDGQVECWGDAIYGGLGDGGTAAAWSPTFVQIP